MPSPNSYPTDTVFNVTTKWEKPIRRHEVAPGFIRPVSSEPSFHVGVVQFEDDGTFSRRSQLDEAIDTVRRVRDASLDGAIVVVFIHGWHHNAAWNRTSSILATDLDGDDHFHSFRLVLESLTLRELERPHWRPVVGIYIAWNGDPVGGLGKALSNMPGLTHFTFWNRYPVAQRIGASRAFQDTLRSIIMTTKEPRQPFGSQPESPLIMIGHSMGALMLESGLLALLEAADQPLIRHEPLKGTGAVQLTSGQDPVSFPDLVLALNSAADSNIAKSIHEGLRRHDLKKTAAGKTTVGAEIRFDPPIVVSVTSTGDIDTKLWWRIGQGVFAPWRATDGHDRDLFTHDFVLTARDAICRKRPTDRDYGQNWHCLRIPTPAVGVTPDIPVDLPVREREGVDEETVPHRRYTIMSRGDKNQARLLWVFQVGPELIKNHNDIFNSKARSLILALIQISGAVASLATDWADSFEPE